jgi:hypothetical protein
VARGLSVRLRSLGQGSDAGDQRRRSAEPADLGRERLDQQVDERRMAGAAGLLRPRVRRAVEPDPRRRDVREPVRGPHGRTAERLPLRLGLLERAIRALRQRRVQLERRLDGGVAPAPDRARARPAVSLLRGGGGTASGRNLGCA